MGSAAPSGRRWLALLLLTVVGAALAALAVGSLGGTGGERAGEGDRRPAPSLRSETAAARPAGPALATLAVSLQPGWEVPEAEAVAASDGDDHGTGAGHVPGSEAGTPTVGAALPVSPGAAMVLLHGAVPRRLAYRTGVADRWGTWQTITTEAGEGPDGLTGEEGGPDADNGEGGPDADNGEGGPDADNGAGGPDGLQPTTVGPLWIGQGNTDIEFVVLAGEGTPFDVTFLHTAREDASLDPAGASIGSADPGGSPPIIAREQWADADWDYANEDCDEGPGVSDRIQAVVIHHTVTTNDYSESDVVGILRAIRYGHVEVNGWCDIGYNFVVDRFGRIWEARTGSATRNVIGGHARGFNTSTVGIALLGRHQSGSGAAPSAAAAAAVEELAHWRLAANGVDPAGRTWLRNRSNEEPLRLAGLAWHHVPTVLAHRDLGATGCPGGHGVALTRALPGRLAARRDLGLPYTVADWRPHDHGPGFVVADAIGGLRPAGAASPWPQAPAGPVDGGPVVAVGGTLAGGYLLTASGGLIGYGTAPAIDGRPAGQVTALDLVVRSDGASGWVLDATGRLRGFGGATDLAAVSVADPVALSLDDAGRGHVLGRDGTLGPVGSTPAAAIAGGLPGGAAAVDLDLRADGTGWVLDDAGRLHGIGGTASTHVESPAAVRALAAATTGTGGWVLDAEGQLWPFAGARLVFPVGTDASAGHAVDLDHVGVVYRPDFVSGDDARFINGLYELFLGRAPTLVETDLDVTELEQGARRLDLTTTMARSEHWSASTVDELYQSALGRAPDPEGRAYWLGQIAAGLQLQDLGTYFYGSREYANAAGSTAAYVTGLYQVLLERPPDAEGLEYWVGLLDSGQATPPDVASGFYASIESRRDRADELHRRIFGTLPDAEGREHWAERVGAAGDAGAAAEMAASARYYHLVVDGPDP